MSDINVTLSATVAMQVQAAIENRLARLYAAQISGRLDPFGRAVTDIAVAELRQARDRIVEQLYPDLEPDPPVDLSLGDHFQYAEGCNQVGHVDGCPGRAGGDHLVMEIVVQ